MKKTDEIKNISTEKLEEKRRKLKKTTLSTSIIMGAAFIFLIFTAIKTKNYAFFAIVGGASLTLLPAFNQLKEIDNELRERNQNQSIK